jgi:hydrogenase expression/formation protein HypC
MEKKMCLAIPSKIVSINGKKGIVDMGGIKKEVGLDFIPEAKIGNWILLHTGFGLEIISEKDALETIEAINEAYHVMPDEY